MSGVFEVEQLQGVVNCLEEDDYQCLMFEGFEGIQAALNNPRTSMLLIGKTNDASSGWIEMLQSDIENVHEVPILAYFQESSPGSYARLRTPSEIKEMLWEQIDDFLLAPLSIFDLHLRIHRLAQRFAEKQDVVRECQSSLISQLGMQQFLGSSPAFIKAIEKIPRIASSDATVLVVGDTGTGKEMCARAIHYLSSRANKPFIPVNCGSIPSDLFENEMFGHESGAFTDARHAHRGLIAEAEGGTLFLDEIDSLPLSAQVKVLRFLQDKQYKPLGANRYRQADTRLIVASNQDLRCKVREGAFREDLYYRLKIISLLLPPLLERREDIVPLALHFLAASARDYKCDASQLSQSCVNRLLSHAWPGNVRELENVIRQAAILSEGTVIQACDLDLPVEARTSVSSTAEPLKVAKARVIEKFERAYLTEIVSMCDGNISKAARHAQKNRREFFALLKKYNITANQRVA